MQIQTTSGKNCPQQKSKPTTDKTSLLFFRTFLYFSPLVFTQVHRCVISISLSVCLSVRPSDTIYYPTHFVDTTSKHFQLVKLTSALIHVKARIDPWPGQG